MARWDYISAKSLWYIVLLREKKGVYNLWMQTLSVKFLNPPNDSELHLTPTTS